MNCQISGLIVMKQESSIHEQAPDLGSRSVFILFPNKWSKCFQECVEKDIKN